MGFRCDKWTAFLLSLAVPGTGQLGAGSLWCLPWFVAAGVCGAMGLTIAENSSLAAGGLLQFLLFFALGACSAEHAKRLLETSTSSPPRNRTRLVWTPRGGRAVQLRIELDSPQSPAAMWSQIAELGKFLTIDPFHQKVILMRPAAAVGVDLVLSHNAFGLRFLRFGRILRWHEGREYAFSDLSQKGARHGFPHVFFVRIEPPPADVPNGCRLTITIRGKWVSHWVPKWLGLCWLKYVCLEHARLLRKAM